MADNKFIGYKIKSIRKSKGLTQAELAKMIGKTESSVQKYENGITEIPMSVLENISNALGVSILVLMDIEQLSSLASDYLKVGNIGMAELMVDVAQIQFDKKYSDLEKLQTYFEELNEVGKAEALKRVKELMCIDEYVNDINTNE